jgi:hypothetical protein
MKQKEEEGAFVKIQLDDKFHCYGRIIIKKYYAFYDCRTESDLPLDVISKCPILFTIGVYSYAVKKDRWEIIGWLPLEEKLKTPPTFFVQDPINPNLLFLYNPLMAKMIPASLPECQGLERMAVWQPEHVEQRLRDYYSNVSNSTVESLKLKGK